MKEHKIHVSVNSSATHTDAGHVRRGVELFGVPKTRNLHCMCEKLNSPRFRHRRIAKPRQRLSKLHELLQNVKFYKKKKPVKMSGRLVTQ